jgi:hypothetical protein
VIQAIKQHGGYVVKDTGDGGLAWFGDNGPELYEKSYKEVVTGRGARLRHSISSGAEAVMVPSLDSARQSLDCACALLTLAEKFIQDNFTNYRDWFREAKEREILVEGMTYAVLPPEFKALFRIGVGVASGEPGRDVHLALNAMGDMDLCGVLVNNASLYSNGRDPDHSMVLADHATCLNLLLNSDRFHAAYMDAAWGERVSGPEAWEAKLRDTLGMAGSVLPDGSYHFPGLAFTMRRSGYHIVGQERIAKEHSLKLEPEDIAVALTEDGRLSDPWDGSEVKIIYEVQPVANDEP